MRFSVRRAAVVFAAVLLSCTSVATGAFSATASPAGSEVQAAVAAPSPWYQSGYNQSRTADNPLEVTLNNVNVPNLRQQWSLRTPEPCCDAPQTTDVVSVNGTAYTVGGSGDVHAVVAATGVPKWSATAEFCAYEQWGPALHQGRLLVPTSACHPDDYNSYLTAYDAVSGAVRWRHEAVWTMREPLTFGGVAYVEDETDQHQRLEALDVRTGSVLWRKVIDGLLSLHLAADESNLYLSSESGLQALDPATGAVRWTRSVPGSEVLTSSGHVVTAGTSSGRTVITSFGPSGARLWQHQLAGSDEFFLSATDVEVLVSQHAGLVQALGIAHGSLSWSRSLATTVTAQPAIANNVVYVPTVAGTSARLVALQDHSGVTVWTSPALAVTGDTGAAPSVAASTVFFPSSGEVHAYRLP